MIIHISSANHVELNDRDNFKAFKVTLGSTDLTPVDIASALSGIATVEADGKTVWISGGALKNWQGEPQPAEWVAAFDKMVESVKKFGWVNEADGAVRAHIEGA